MRMRRSNRRNGPSRHLRSARFGSLPVFYLAGKATARETDMPRAKVALPLVVAMDLLATYAGPSPRGPR